MLRKRKAFTMVELVIVVAIIGILALMILPQFNQVTDNAKLNIFQGNCHVVSYAIIVYQSEHDGNLPPDESALDPYLSGGWISLNGNPQGAVYQWSGTTFTASYTAENGVIHTFVYPD